MNPTQFDLKLSICPAVWNALQTTSLRGHRAFPEVVLFDSAIAAVESSEPDWSGPPLSTFK